MINSKTTEYYQLYRSSRINPFLGEYLLNKQYQEKKLNYIIILFIVSLLLFLIFASKPIFAKTNTEPIKLASIQSKAFLHKHFEEQIRNTHNKAHIENIAKGAIYIKKIKYINSKPIKINIVELNTKINPNLKITPATAGEKLNSKATVRKIAQREGAIIAINAGFFKQQTGTPLGALMVNRNILTGGIFNRVGIAIFEDDDGISYKMDNINFDINAYNKNVTIKIDNINQPRMLSTYSLIYTSDWGKYSPVAPKNCYNLQLENNYIKKISANPIELNKNSVVIQAPTEIISKLAKNNKKIYIDIKLQENLKEAKHIIGAGPYLIKNGEIFVDYKKEKFEAIAGKNPRSAIGFKKDGTLVFLTVDGREKTSVGMTLYELARLMQEIGCENAMNFDGGSSSTLFIKGEIKNNATNSTGIPVSNALIVTETKSEIQLSSL